MSSEPISPDDMTTLSVEAESQSRSHWTRAIVIFLLAGAVLVGTSYQAIESVVHIWSVSDTFGYGFLILPIVLFLIYDKRRLLARYRPQANPWALLWIVGWLGVQVTGEIAGIMLFKQFAFVALLQGLFSLVFGWPISKLLAFPLLYLFFAVPAGAQVVPYLQHITAEMVTPMVRFSGIPAYLDGFLIELPSGSFVVAEVCSGARFLLTSITLGILASSFLFRSWTKRIAFVALCIVVPILANIVRAYGIIMLAHLSNYRLAVSVDHIIYGFIFLSFVLVVLGVIGYLFRDKEATHVGHSAHKVQRSAAKFSRTVLLTIMTVAMIISGKVWATHVTAPPADGVELALTAPHLSSPWALNPNGEHFWTPSFPGADSTLLLNYRIDANNIWLFQAHYDYQREGGEAISDINLIEGKYRNVMVPTISPFEVELPEGRLAVKEAVLHHKNDRILVWIWYRIGDFETASKIEGKLLEVLQTLQDGSRMADAYAIATEYDDNREAARERLLKFLIALREQQDTMVETSELRQ